MKRKPQFFSAGMILILCLLYHIAGAQMKPAVRDSIYSEVLKETRIFMVTMPEAYTPGTTGQYDVMYAIDGERQERILPSIQSFGEWLQIVPPNIIVNIYNTDRTRDLTPTNAENMPTSGGAAKFLAFLKTELIPYINKKYPSSNNNALFGHSFGGLFAMYAFMHEPNLFESYIICDPSFWWDNRYLNKFVAEKLDATYGSSNKSLFIAGREGKGMEEMGINSMDSILKAKAIPGLNFKTVAYPNENHGTVVLKTLYDGIRYAYTGYANRSGDIIYYPMNGIMLKDKPIKVWSFSDPETVTYTTDGTEPKLNSAKMSSEIILQSPGQLKLKAFPYRIKNEKVITGNFVQGEVLPAVTLAKHAISGGLNYTYYKGVWDEMPNFKKLKPFSKGLLGKGFAWTQLPSQADFAIVFEGYIKIEEEGYYMFNLQSDDGSKLFLNNRLLMDHDGHREMGLGLSQTYTVPLQKGFYPIKMEYFRKGDKGDLYLQYTMPNTQKLVGIPEELLYYKK